MSGEPREDAFYEQLIELKKMVTWDEVAVRAGLPSGEVARGRVRRYKKRAEGQFPLPAPPEILSSDIELPETFTLETCLDVAEKLRSLMDLIDPVVTAIDLHFSAEPIAIMFTSCAHLGGRYTWYKKIRETLDRVKNVERLYIASLGDEIEGFLPGFRDARAVTDQILPLKIQMAMMTAVLQDWSVDGRILFGCSSQHGGQWFEKEVGLNPIKHEYQQIRCPYFDGRGIVKLWVGDELYILVVAHAFKGTSIYNKNHAQRRASLFDYPSADVIAMGDKHSYSVQHMADRIDEYKVGLRKSPYVWHLQAGTAKTGPDPYTIRGWQHGWFEWPVLVFYPGQHQIKQALDLDDLEYFLNRKEVN